MILLAGLLSCRTEKPALIPPEAPPPPELPPPAPEVPTVQDILTRIAGLLAEGDFDGALGLFDEIPSPDRESTGIRLLKASVLSSAGKLADARTLVNGLLQEAPDNNDILFVLSTIEGASGKEREQRAVLDRILAADPNHVDALISQGTINLQNRSLRNAASFFDRVLALEPENPDAIIGRAGVYRYNRDSKNAELLLDRAVALYPESPVPWSERARIYREAGYPEHALADLDKARALAPGDYWIAVDRGNVLLDLNKKPEALEEFERAIRIEPGNFLAYVYSAGIKDETRDYEGAEKDYAVLARIKPEYYFAFEGLGMYRMKKGLWIEARDAFMEAYRRAPEETGYALLAAINWMRAGRIGDPKPFLAQALRQIPRDTLEWYVFRLFHDLTGDNDVAIRIDRERNLDTKARMLYYLANYYDIRGNKVLADKYFLQVKEQDRRGIPEWRLNEWALEARNLTDL